MPDVKSVRLQGIDRVLEDDPLDEEATRALLLALNAGGRRTDALRRYSQFQQQLHEEMGIEPSPETVNVAEQLKSAGIAFGNFNTVEDFSRHPHLRRIAVETPEGAVRLPATPAVFEDERSLEALPVNAWITSVGFTPDGMSVVGRSFDGGVRVWDAASGSIVHTFTGQASGQNVVVVPSGRTALAGSEDGIGAEDVRGEDGKEEKSRGHALPRRVLRHPSF